MCYISVECAMLQCEIQTGQIQLDAVILRNNIVLKLINNILQDPTNGHNVTSYSYYN